MQMAKINDEYDIGAAFKAVESVPVVIPVSAVNHIGMSSIHTQRAVLDNFLHGCAELPSAVPQFPVQRGLPQAVPYGNKRDSCEEKAHARKNAA